MDANTKQRIKNSMEFATKQRMAAVVRSILEAPKVSIPVGVDKNKAPKK